MIPGECNITTTKATYFGFFIRFNLALGLFRKKGNVLVLISMSLIIIISSSFRRHLAERFFFLNFFRSYFYSFFLYLLLHQIKQILLRIYLEYLGKTNRPTKQNKKKLIRFISPALPCGLPHSSLFICVFFFFFFILFNKE